MEITHRQISEIKPYENNPRLNGRAVEAVMKSIGEFGFRVPVIITADNVIIAGHTRHEAAEKMGIKEIPCIVADDLTPEQIKAFRLIDNKTAEFADWDFEKLRQELQAINFDFSDFGFDDVLAEIREELENTTQELSVSDYSDEAFECECPRCGFRFNR